MRTHVARERNQQANMRASAQHPSSILTHQTVGPCVLSQRATAFLASMLVLCRLSTSRGLLVTQASRLDLLASFTNSANQGLQNTRVLVYGPAESLGVFTQGSGFSIASGVVLSTWRVADIPPNKPSHDYLDVGVVGDSIVFAILMAPVQPMTVTFEYVFASAELPKYSSKPCCQHVSCM